jgi:DNA repair protein RecN (Recombination protein N)
MLKHLKIQNYALIESVEMTLDKGFSVITGETGAGKSILLGALNLLLGKRAELGLLKDNNKKTIVEGEFDLSAYKLKPVFDNLDLDYDNTTIIRREILPSGKTRAFINDTPVTLNNLKFISSYLIDIHSQFATYELFDNDKQLQIVTEFADAKNELEHYKKLYNTYKSLKNEISVLGNEFAEIQKEKDYLEFLLKELEEADLSSIESLDLLENQINELANAQEIKEYLFKLSDNLTEGELSVENQIIEQKNNIAKISNYTQALKTLYQRITALHIEIQDISSEAVSLAENIEDNPELLAELQQKQYIVEKLLHKHSCNTIEELKQKEEEIADKLLKFNLSDKILETKRKELKDIENQLTETAKNLSDKRREGALNLADEVQKLLVQIGIPNAQFKIDVFTVEKFTDYGKDAVEFYFSANKGKSAQPLKQIASGGELSRVMLALKKIESEKKQLPTLIFDEIDTGVSGEVSDKIGEILQKTAQKSQLICITHSPQVASKAEHHWFVYKETTDNQTVSNLKKLNNTERINEIAKMLSGNKITQTAIEHAKNLLVQ